VYVIWNSLVLTPAEIIPYICNVRLHSGLGLPDKTIFLKKQALLLLFLLVSFLWTGCVVRSVYIPVSQNTPLFEKQKELKAIAYLGDNHVELQAAFNPFSHLALTANINYGTGVSIYEAGIGTYGYSETKKWRWEVFAGYGYNTNFTYQTANYNVLFNKAVNDYEVRSLYFKYYVQPSFGYFGEIKMYKLNYSFALSSRLCALYFNTYSFQEINNAATLQAGQTVYAQNVNIKNSFLYALEPCLTNKVGMKNIYGILQIQAIIPYSGQVDVRNTVFAPPFMISLGLQYNLVFKTRNQEPVK
jgi:hypothetical protein